MTILLFPLEKWTIDNGPLLTIVDCRYIYLTNTNALFVKLIILKTLINYFESLIDTVWLDIM